jgi:hypothetical protein
MADPIIISIPADVWTKVATNVKTGIIQKCDSPASFNPSNYLQTYRMTGEAAPSSSSIEGVLMFHEHDEIEEISSTDFIDVYVKARGTNGELRVSL